MMAIIDRKTKRFVWEQRDPSWGHQHNAEMLPNGNITFFANGVYNLIQPFCSRAVELDPRSGKIVWEYKAPQSWTFFSPIISGVQRLEGGNTLICDGMGGPRARGDVPGRIGVGICFAVLRPRLPE